MCIQKIETKIGRLDVISSIRESKKPGIWFHRLTIDEDDSFRLFGKPEKLKRIISTLKEGINTRVKFRTNNVNGKEFREVIEIEPMKGSHNSPDYISVSKEFSLVENGLLNVKRLIMSIKCIESDCNFILNELNKVKGLIKVNENDDNKTIQKNQED
jgi:hypothetical protein